MRNTDKLVDYIIANAGRLTPEKIKSLGSVVGALGKEPANPEPNNIKPTLDENLTDVEPFDISKLTKAKIEGEPAREIKIYPNKIS